MQTRKSKTECLSAAKAIVADTSGQKTWMYEQKTRLKTQRTDELIQALQPHLEEPGVEDSDATVRRCHRYLSHRREQLNHQSALGHDLPIGSGKIESAHRHIVQQRLTCIPHALGAGQHDFDFKRSSPIFFAP